MGQVRPNPSWEKIVMSFSSCSSCRRHGRSLFRALQLLRFSSSSSASVTEANPSFSPPKAHHFIADHLTSKLGFSAKKAIGASKHLSHLKSIEQPESFVGFMRSHGSSDAHIKKTVSFNPRCLRFDVDETVAPKIAFFDGCRHLRTRSQPHSLHQLPDSRSRRQRRPPPKIPILAFCEPRGDYKKSRG